MRQKTTHRCGYLKLIVDGRTLSIFPASQKIPYHARMARLQGCCIQPALEADYREFKRKNKHKEK